MGKLQNQNQNIFVVAFGYTHVRAVHMHSHIAKLWPPSFSSPSIFYAIFYSAHFLAAKCLPRNFLSANFCLLNFCLKFFCPQIFVHKTFVSKIFVCIICIFKFVVHKLCFVLWVLHTRRRSPRLVGWGRG